MFAVVVHDVVGCDKGWHISPCFLWKERINLPIVLFAFGTVYGFVDVFRPGVVCGNNKVPVTEYAIEVAQVMCGCERPVAPTLDTALGLSADSITGKYFSSSGRP